MLDFIPKRYVFSLIGLSATTLAIALQTNISLAIVYMVRRNENSTVFKLPNNLSISDDVYHIAPSYLTTSSSEFDWSPQIQGILIGCQFIGVTIGFFTGGRLAEVYGAKFTIVATLLLASVVTVLAPMAARWSVYALLFSRLIVGFGTGPVLPILVLLMSRWIPQSEQNLTASVVLAGYGTGAFVSYLTAGAICASPSFGWPAVFYIGGLSGILFCPLCYLLLKDSPQMHQSISKEELEYISKNLGPKKQKVTSVPWKSILTSVPFWALAAGTFGQLWIQSFYTTSISMYLGGVLRMESAQNGILSSLPHIIRVVAACVAGVFIDFLCRRMHVPKVFVRKGVTLVSSACACVGFAGLVLCGTSTTWNTVFIIFGALCSDFCLFGVLLAPIDMAPNLEGTLSGILSGLGNIPFIALPAVIGYFTKDNNTTLEWRNVFYCSVAVIALTTVIYLIFGSSTPQPWATKGTEDASDKKSNKSKEIGNCNGVKTLLVDCYIVSTHL